MAIFRNVNMSFWTDTKVVDEYTPEDRYFMLWALTNNYTNIIGCYEVSIKQIARDLGYDPDSNIVENLLKRFKDIHKTIDYDFDTKELIVINWYKFNWSSSPKLNTPLYAAIENVKSDEFHDYLAKIYNQRESVKKEEFDEEGNPKDMLLIPYRYSIEKKAYPIDTTNSNSNSNRNSNRNSINIYSPAEAEQKIPYQEIIEHLNKRIGSNYKHTTKKTKDLIKARFNEKFTLEDFKIVIDKKCVEWMGTDMQKYLRPETLFSPKFESYLNQQVNKKITSNPFIEALLEE